ncbi:hypothetical protein TGAM01_v205903 [Trichoderma gamsii]|uniref:Uncharacterized protein n=1 Tax=Trichoderma gamsii TaxID=398673 RepID=A0A2P4ZLP5_9HYPO|nr:hypothetical protein TGAM01_v205903 [Trichoderma gamsii]PON25216.1 hypothetical protein TGAM01_v205903 [Trichoderma gamsii]
MGADRVSGWTRKKEAAAAAAAEEEEESFAGYDDTRSTQEKRSVSGSVSIVACKLRGGAARQGPRRNLGAFALDFGNKPECQISANKCQPTGTGAGAGTGTGRAATGPGTSAAT